VFIISTTHQLDIASGESHDRPNSIGMVRERRDLSLDQWARAYEGAKTSDAHDGSAEDFTRP
jgi:hypothetical protein